MCVCLSTSRVQLGCLGVTYMCTLYIAIFISSTYTYVISDMYICKRSCSLSRQLEAPQERILVLVRDLHQPVHEDTPHVGRDVFLFIHVLRLGPEPRLREVTGFAEIYNPRKTKWSKQVVSASLASSRVFQTSVSLLWRFGCRSTRHMRSSQWCGEGPET